MPAPNSNDPEAEAEANEAEAKRLRAEAAEYDKKAENCREEANARETVAALVRSRHNLPTKSSERGSQPLLESVRGQTTTLTKDTEPAILKDLVSQKPALRLLCFAVMLANGGARTQTIRESLTGAGYAWKSNDPDAQIRTTLHGRMAARHDIQTKKILTKKGRTRVLWDFVSDSARLSAYQEVESALAG